MAINEEKIKVALLSGGDSSEREVCFMSAKAMANALASERYTVTVFDVASTATRAHSFNFGGDVLGKKPRHAVAAVEWNQLITTLYTTGYDVVLPALHGGRGEDGTLQALLDVAEIPYVGSAQHTSAIAIDKQVCKAVLAEHGIPVPRGYVYNSMLEFENREDTTLEPCVVKPNGGGSSVGVTIFRTTPTENALADAVQAALADGNGALVEELVTGIEVTASVIGDGATTRALPLIEIEPQSEVEFFDYKTKYTPGAAKHVTPPRISEESQTRITDYTLRAYRVLGCRDVARADFIVREDGSVCFLEINTLPGMTETSLVPDAARAAGISFEELVESFIKGALNRK